jgi:energy-coupling factor transporter ATP-binding protein EcfA2
VTTLALERVTFDHPGPVRALDGIDLVIPAGDVLALVGPNGSGKSTLLQLLDGLLRPSSGRVMVDGRDAATMRVAELARSVALGMAEPDRQLFGRTVLAEASFGLRQLGRSRDEAEELALGALEAAGLADVADAHPGDLGAARRRLLVIASVVAMGTPIVALDEPTAGLDARGRDRARSIVAGLRDEGRTVVLAGHDLRFLAAVADRVVELDLGRIVRVAESADIGDAAERRRPLDIVPGLRGRFVDRGGRDAARSGRSHRRKGR